MSDQRIVRLAPFLGHAHGKSPSCLGSIKLELRQIGLTSFQTNFAYRCVLGNHDILEHQGIHIGGQEAAVGIFRGADNGLTSNVEAGVDQYRTASQPVEGVEKTIKTRVAFLIDGLEPRL